VTRAFFQISAARGFDPATDAALKGPRDIETQTDLKSLEVHMDSRKCRIVILFALGVLAHAAVARAQDVELWRARAAQIPIGATVKLRTHDGVRMRAVLMAVDGSGMVVKPVARLPEPSRHLSFDSIDALDRFEDRVSFPKYIGLGAAISGTVFLILLAGAR